MGRPYIIAIDAVAGGGKTTLSGAVNAALHRPPCIASMISTNRIFIPLIFTTGGVAGQI